MIRPEGLSFGRYTCNTRGDNYKNNTILSKSMSKIFRVYSFTSLIRKRPRFSKKCSLELTISLQLHAKPKDGKLCKSARVRYIQRGNVTTRKYCSLPRVDRVTCSLSAVPQSNLITWYQLEIVRKQWDT